MVEKYVISFEGSVLLPLATGRYVAIATYCSSCTHQNPLRTKFAAHRHAWYVYWQKQQPEARSNIIRIRNQVVYAPFASWHT